MIRPTKKKKRNNNTYKTGGEPNLMKEITCSSYDEISMSGNNTKNQREKRERSAL
jgi:hypothetical protein